MTEEFRLRRSFLTANLDFWTIPKIFTDRKRTVNFNILSPTWIIPKLINLFFIALFEYKPNLILNAEKSTLQKNPISPRNRFQVLNESVKHNWFCQRTRQLRICQLVTCQRKFIIVIFEQMIRKRRCPDLYPERKTVHFTWSTFKLVLARWLHRSDGAIDDSVQIQYWCTMEEDRVANQRSAIFLSFTLALYISNGFELRILGVGQMKLSGWKPVHISFVKNTSEYIRGKISRSHYMANVIVSNEHL